MNNIKTHKFKTIELPDIREVQNKEWVLFGVKNDFPQKVLDLFNGCAIHNTAIQAIRDGIVGEGIVYYGTDIVNRTGETLEKIYEKIVLDYLIFGGYSLNVIWNQEGTNWAELYHLPFQNVRAEKPNNFEVVENYYYSKNWNLLNKNKPYKYPSYSTTKTQDQYASQIYYCYEYSPGNIVYPLPYYRGALSDIELDIRISKFHNSNIANGLSPSLIINMRNGIPSPDEQQQIYHDITETFTGEENAGRFFLNFCDVGKEMTIEPINSANDQYYITLEQRITSRILTAHRITSPLLIGIREGTGFSSNKDEIIVSYGHLMGTVILPKQKVILDSLSKIYGENLIVNPSPIIIDNETIETDENENTINQNG